MRDLMTIKEIVIDKLIEDRKARDDDMYLYLQVCRACNPSVEYMNFGFVLDNMDALGIPKFESVRRARQRAQAEFPKLRGSMDAVIARRRRERDFYKFAKE
jgi:hypothetical protein